MLALWLVCFDPQEVENWQVGQGGHASAANL